MPENRIATRLDDKPWRPEWRISENDSEIDYLLFKYAAGTGWDCPRAHVLVMFREIDSPVFRTQTLGRIVRMAVHDGTFRLFNPDWLVFHANSEKRYRGGIYEYQSGQWVLKT